MLDFGAVLINWNHAEETLRCIEMIQSWPRLRSKIVVVDNGSSKEDLIQLRNASITLLENKTNLGYAEAVNLGLKEVFTMPTDTGLVLNTDLITSFDDIVQLLWTIKSHPEIAIVGPILHEHSMVSIGGRDIGRYTDTRVLLPKSQLPERKLSPMAVDYVPGTLFMLKKQAYQDTGDLDANFFFSGELADYCQRLVDSGWTCSIDLQAAGKHLQNKRDHGHRGTLYVYYSLRNRFLYTCKHGGKSKSQWTMLGLRQAIGALLTFNLARARALLLAIQDGRKGIFGNQNQHFIKEGRG